MELNTLELLVALAAVGSVLGFVIYKLSKNDDSSSGGGTNNPGGGGDTNKK